MLLNIVSFTLQKIATYIFISTYILQHQSSLMSQYEITTEINI